MTDLYVGLDVSLELTNVCVFDGDGRPGARGPRRI